MNLNERVTIEMDLVRLRVTIERFGPRPSPHVPQLPVVRPLLEDLRWVARLPKLVAA